MEYLLEMWPLVAVIVAGIAFALWWRWRQPRRERQKQLESLSALATSLGGVVAGPDHAAPWSAQLLPILKNHTGGMVDTVRNVGLQGPQCDAALEFPRGRWRVRVSEASLRRHNVTSSGGTTTVHEHRIEVVTAQLPPMQIVRRVTGAEPVSEPPVSVAQRGSAWQRLQLPAPADQQLAVFASDLGAASHMVNQEVLEFLVTNVGALPLVLTFETGLVYGVMLNQINPNTLLTSVDTILGALERIPGAAPVGHPS